MSALNDDLGGMLNTLVDVPRAMSPAEARMFLITGVFPDLTKPAPEEGRYVDDVELSETDARLWLGTLTACGLDINRGEVLDTVRRTQIIIEPSVELEVH